MKTILKTVLILFLCGTGLAHEEQVNAQKDIVEEEAGGEK